MFKLPAFVRWTSRRTSAPSSADDSLEAFGSERAPYVSELARVPRGTVAAGVLVFCVLPALVLGGVAMQWVGRVSAPETASLTIESDPAGAEVLVAGVHKGTTPLTLEVAPGPQQVEIVLGERRQALTATATADAAVVHRVTFVEPPAPAPVPVRTSGTRASRPPPAPRPAGPVAGWLTVSSGVPLQVIEDGQVIGTTAVARIMLAAGRHDLRFVNEALGFSARRVVQVAPGRRASIRIDTPSVPLNINAVPWADAWIDGARVGTTPIGNHRVTIGTHEIVFRHPELGERRQTVVVALDKPARVSVDMRRPGS